MKSDSNKRFIYLKILNSVIDELTGKRYHCEDEELVELLNKLDYRANKNAEKYYDLKNKY